MSYHRKAWTEKKIEQRLKDGRGKGVGANYRPMLEVTDLSSSGLSRRVYGDKTGRVHHLLSDVEYQFYLMLWWSKDIVDIREQFPLDRDLTREVAMMLAIKHPSYPGTQVDTIMTVDFLVTRVSNGREFLEAYDIKRSEAAEDIRTLDKLEISRAGCELMEVPHHLVYHSELPHQKIKNLEWIMGGMYQESEQEDYPGFYEEHRTRLLATLDSSAKEAMPLNEFCGQYDQACGLRQGSALRVARMLMHERALVPDLTSFNLAEAPVRSFALAARRGQLRAVGGR